MLKTFVKVFKIIPEFKILRLTLHRNMGESFQDYSSIQDYEADFPKKVSIKMLN